MTDRAAKAGRGLAAAIASEPPPARIFISYATADGAKAAAELRAELEASDPKLYSVWQDIVRLRGGRDWWSQIEAAIRHPVLQHLVLIVTPAVIRHALERQSTEIARPVIRDELRLARQEGKSVIAVRGPGLDPETKLPRWLGQVMHLDKPEHKETFLRLLAGNSVQDPVPLMAQPPPADYVPRGEEFAALKADLLSTDTRDAVAITAALRGTTGYGKTVLAQALAADADIEDAYVDGVLWITLGDKGGGQVIPFIGDIIGALGEPREEFNTPIGAANALAKALGNKCVLLIIDDVWKREDVEPFLKGGPQTTRLITTRLATTLPSTAKEHRIGPMAENEAWQLLASGLPEAEVEACREALIKLADRRQNWPQGLRLANGYLRTRMGLSKRVRESRNRHRANTPVASSLADAIASANQALDRLGSAAFDPSRVRPEDADERDQGRHQAVAAAMDLNLGLLTTEARQRFAELAVFPEDVNVPIGIAGRLWAETAKLDHLEAERLLEAFDDVSLLLDLDLVRGTFRFHDSVREWLIDEAQRAGVRDTTQGMSARHRQLAAVLGRLRGERGGDRPSTHYVYRYLPLHLAEAGERAALEALLTDVGWMEQKLAALASPLPLIEDYRAYAPYDASNKTAVALVGRALAQSAGAIARQERQLVAHLLGRLRADMAPGVGEVLATARRALRPPALIPKRPTLTPADSALLWTFEGHGDPVNAVAFSPDGRRIVSGSDDNTLRLWDAETGAAVGAPLEGHGGSVRAVAFSPDGRRIVSGSWDKTLRLWDAETGAAVGAPLEGHGDWVRAVAFSPDGRRIVSGSWDKTLRLWDAASGAELARFEGDAGIATIAVTPDTLAAGDTIGRVHILDWIPDAAAKAAWFARFDGEGSGAAAANLPAPPPADIAQVATEMQVTAAQRAAARFLETYRGRHLFALADGRVYLDGLIAVSSLDHARATLDLLANQKTDA
jgi:hypothetical protein